MVDATEIDDGRCEYCKRPCPNTFHVICQLAFLEFKPETTKPENPLFSYYEMWRTDPTIQEHLRAIIRVLAEQAERAMVVGDQEEGAPVRDPFGLHDLFGTMEARNPHLNVQRRLAGGGFDNNARIARGGHVVQPRPTETRNGRAAGLHGIPTELREDIEEGQVGINIGGTVDEVEEDEQGNRVVRGLQLREVSLVAMPDNPEQQILTPRQHGRTAAINRAHQFITDHQNAQRQAQEEPERIRGHTGVVINNDEDFDRVMAEMHQDFDRNQARPNIPIAADQREQVVGRVEQTRPEQDLITITGINEFGRLVMETVAMGDATVIHFQSFSTARWTHPQRFAGQPVDIHRTVDNRAIGVPSGITPSQSVGMLPVTQQEEPVDTNVWSSIATREFGIDDIVYLDKNQANQVRVRMLNADENTNITAKLSGLRGDGTDQEGELRLGARSFAPFLYIRRIEIWFAEAMLYRWDVGIHIA